MAEHEFRVEARDHFRKACQEDAWQRGLANFGGESYAMREWYEWAWRASYAAHVGEEPVMPGQRCDKCGFIANPAAWHRH
jgi:hypothetical protein